jgi:hypothetical protein
MLADGQPRQLYLPTKEEIMKPGAADAAAVAHAAPAALRANDRVQGGLHLHAWAAAV